MNASEKSKNLLQTLDALLVELTGLAQTPDTDSDELFRQGVDILRLLFQPDAASVFLFGTNGLRMSVVPDSPEFHELFSDSNGYLEQIVSSKEACTFKDSQDRTIVSFAVRAHQEPEGVLVLRTKPGGFLDLHKSVVQKIGNILNAHLNSRFAQSQLGGSAAQLKQFSLSCMSTLIHNELVELLANDVRFVLAAERTQYFETCGSQCKLLAVSSVSQFEDRTSLLQSSKALAMEVSRLGTAIASTSANFSSNLGALLKDYEEKSGFPFVVLFPIFEPTDPQNEPGKPAGVLLIEYTSAPPCTELVQSSNVVVPQMEKALQNAAAFSSFPMHRAWLGLHRRMRSKGLRKSGIALALLVLLMLLSFFWKVDFKVRMYGSLHTANERKVFSPRDAFVQRVLVSHGERVEKGQRLVDLRSPELQQLLDEVDGEIAKLKNLKSSKRVVLNQTTTGKNVDRYDSLRLAGEIAELDLRIEAQNEKRDFVLAEIEELVVHAPISGTVVTWDLQKLLHEKPVQWGETLLKIAAEDEKWELRFLAPEKSMGYVHEARNRQTVNANGLSVDYFFNSRPEDKFSTRTEVVGNATENDSKNGLGVRVICEIDPKQELQRHGAQVTGDIHCGKRSVAFIWTHELIDTIRRHLVR